MSRIENLMRGTLSRGLAIVALLLWGTAFSIAAESSPPAYDPERTYDRSGTQVTYSETDTDGDTFSASFVNAWWTRGEAPSFGRNDGPWKRVSKVTRNHRREGFLETIGVLGWSAEAAYPAGSVVKEHGEQCYSAKWWTKGVQPPVSMPVNAWETPWQLLSSCPDTDVGAPVIDKLPPGNEVPPEKIDTPIVPPVIPVAPSEPPPPPAPALPASDGTLPETGYAFLRQVTEADWDWLFPMRSGRPNPQGATRNQPPVALPDGSTDVFTLRAFRKAVLDYNTWAKTQNYKQFLNEGTPKQQAQEFLAFWAKSSRETSGSWKGAPAPWIDDYTNAAGEHTKAWKGALYWVEEVGYSTRPDGTSPAINYVDKSSTSYPPVAGRSYYGRGVIQLSWNYNYGAFSSWLYDNGFRRELITTRDILLSRPDYVASDGELAILSGIWFWMTPQGTKPSSHDVLYGDVYNISGSSTEPGLPQLRNGFTVNGQSTGPAAPGDTSDSDIFAFRFGTITNIVNGGIECNGAAKWHEGPPQRASYYNAYTMYFNDRFPGLNATRIPQATSIWEASISPSSPEQVQSATCFNQKSYYGW